MLTIAQKISDALGASGEYRAGGTDVQERRRSGITRDGVVDIATLPGLDRITREQDGTARVGALVTIDAFARDPHIAAAYPGLAQAAGGLATPQIRKAGTMGGSLLQRVRCWYFRHPAFDCYKKGGSTCPLREGEHHHGVCIDLGPCAYPHPSTIGMALLAYHGQVMLHDGTPLTIEALYGDGHDPHRDHLLTPDQILTEILLPAPTPNERSAYFRTISRAAAEWPLVECVVRLVIQDNRITLARVAVGGVANIPLRLTGVEQALEGQPPSDPVLATAAALAKTGTNPLPGTGYKVELLERTVLETLERALGREVAISQG